MNVLVVLPSVLTVPHLEVIAAARTLGSVTALVVGDPDLAMLARHGVPRVLVPEMPPTTEPAAVADAAVAAVEASRPDAVLLVSSFAGKAVAGRLAVLLDCGAVTDVTGLRVEDGVVVASKPVLQGSWATECAVTRGPAVIAVRPTAFEAREEPGGTPEVVTLPVTPGAAARAVTVEAREALLVHLRENTEFPLPQGIVASEIRAHLEREGKAEDDPHGEEIREETEQALRDQLLLDVLAQHFDVQVEQDELLQYLFTTAQRYGMDPTEFITSADQNGQIPLFVAELARNKSLAVALRKVTVQDASGREVDLTAFIGQDAEEGEDSVEVATEEPVVDQPVADEPAAEEPAEEPAQPAAEEPAAAAPKKATRKRKKDAESE